MIVEAFKDTLELGLQKHNQVVVRIGYLYLYEVYRIPRPNIRLPSP
jgi:hypothetical protein